MQACVLTIPAKSVGAGVQTVTGIVDHTGAPFVGTLFLFHGNSALNTLQTAYRRSYGTDDGVSVRRGQAVDEVFLFGGKILCSGSSGQYSLLDERSHTSFGGFIERRAYVSAVRLGEIDITYDLNNRTGDSLLLTVLGGSDLLTNVGTLSPTTLSVGFPPEALIFREQVLSGASTATGGGDGQYGVGWATRLSGQGFSTIRVTGQGGNARYQRSDLCSALVNGGTPLPPVYTPASERTVTSWDALGAVVSGTANGQMQYVACGGIQAAAGVLLQPLVTGLQEVVTGLDNRMVWVSSVGAPANAAVQTDRAEWAFGMLSAAGRQAGYWCGEDIVGNASLHGARYLSDGDVLRFGTPNGLSTVFTAIAQHGGFSASGLSFSLDWTTVDGVAREWLWLALGDPPPPLVIITPPPPGELCEDCGCRMAAVPREDRSQVVGDRRVTNVPREPRTGHVFERRLKIVAPENREIAIPCA